MALHIICRVLSFPADIALVMVVLWGCTCQHALIFVLVGRWRLRLKISVPTELGYWISTYLSQNAVK
jgi:hypothetical protein